MAGIAFVWRSTRGCRSRRNAVAPPIGNFPEKTSRREFGDAEKNIQDLRIAARHIFPGYVFSCSRPPSPSRLDTSCTCPELNGVSNGFALVLVRATDYSMPHRSQRQTGQPPSNNACPLPNLNEVVP